LTAAFLVAFSIDVECDKDEHWQVRWPLAFRGVEQGIGKSLAPLFEEYGARPTYLLSPEVARHEPSAALLRSLRGCELGTHLHPEFIGASSKVESTSAVACLMQEHEERHALQELTSQFIQVFGERPLSYRAGRFGASARTIGMLDQLGYRVDTSVTPYKLWDYGLDFRRAPMLPYYSSPTDINVPLPVPGLGRGVLEVPVSLRPPPAPAWMKPVTRQLARTRLKRARRLAKWASDPAWFRLGWSARPGLLRFVHEAAERAPGAVLNMMFHNVDVVAGCSPNGGNPDQVQAVLDDLRAVLEESLRCGGSFVTLAELATLR
jgi:hypothetical protein